MAAIAEIAQDLVNKCRKGQFAEVIEKHYSPQIVSIEPVPGPNMPARQEGIEAVQGKTQWWVENHEIHETNVDGPFVGDSQFAVRFRFEVTPKMTGKRITMTEMALYTVKDGKIVQEEFYYNM